MAIFTSSVQNIVKSSVSETGENGGRDSLSSLALVGGCDVLAALAGSFYAIPRLDNVSHL